MHRIKQVLLAAALVLVPAAATAQTDSAFAVSHNGVTLFKIDTAGTITTYTSSTPFIRFQAGSPVGDRVLIDSAGALVAMGSLGIGIIPKEGAGERMMWHPYRASFRAGGVNGSQWNDANIGFYSAAFGQNVQAAGNWSIAAGNGASTAQSYSVSMGFSTNAGGQAAIALGYKATANADYAVAIGRAASASGKTGAIVITDGSTSDSVLASANNQFSLRAAGGIRLYTNSTKTAGVLIQASATNTPWTGCSSVTYVISASNCAYLSGGGTWTNVSDVNRKHGFAAVHGEDVLTRLRRVPITTWTYDADGDEVRHLGPTAQDFHAAFGLGGADDTHIATVDADGVNLAAVKALDARTLAQQQTIAAQQARIEALERENAELRRRQADGDRAAAGLRARLERIEAALAAQGTAAKP